MRGSSVKLFSNLTIVVLRKRDDLRLMRTHERTEGRFSVRIPNRSDRLVRGNRPAPQGRTTLGASLKRYRAYAPDAAPIVEQQLTRPTFFTYNVAKDKP